MGYRKPVRDLARAEAPADAEMNALAKQGRELAGVFTDSPFPYL